MGKAFRRDVWLGTISARLRRPHLLTVLLVFWALFIVYGTTLPFDFSATRDEALASLEHLFEEPWRGLSRTDVISNVLLFLPLGLLAAARLAQRGVRLGPSLVVATVGGCLLSGMVEVVQLFAPSRLTSFLDLIANTAGTAIGAGVGWLGAHRVWPGLEPKVKQFVAQRPLAACAAAMAMALFVVEMSPFDVSIDVGSLKTAIKTTRLIPFGPEIQGTRPPPEPWSWAEEFATAILVGGIIALALRETGQTGLRQVAAATVLVGTFYLIVEGAQWTIRSRVTDMTSVLLAASGAAVGAWWVHRRWWYDPRQHIPLALLIWGIVRVLSSWTPPRFALPDPWQVHLSTFVPFFAYYHRTDIYALSDIINETLDFVPLGVLLAARSPRETVWRVGLIGFGFGLLLELGQFFHEDRVAEITDALSAAVGAMLGYGLWRWGEGVWRQARHRRWRVR